MNKDDKFYIVFFSIIFITLIAGCMINSYYQNKQRYDYLITTKENCKDYIKNYMEPQK